MTNDLISSGGTMSQMMYALRHLQENETPDLKIVGLLLHCDWDATGRVVKLYKPGHLSFERMISSERFFKHPQTGLKASPDAALLYDKPEGDFNE